MKYCSRCLQPDTRPNIEFLPDGICPACNYFDKLAFVDWEERFNIISDIIDKSPKNRDQFHDCIIGVSGGKDSTRQAIWARDKLGLNPLLVCLTYPPDQVSQRGVENLSNLINLGFDVHTLSLAPQTWKKLMRAGFLRFTNFFKSTELALFSTVPRLAIQYKIPLILWGENPGLQIGDLKTLGNDGYDGNNIRNMNTLNGGGLDWMLDEGFQKHELLGYKYPDPSEFVDAKLQIVYLGWFLGDWSLLNNGLYSIANGLRRRVDSPANTGDLYGLSRLDEDWVIVNQMIKYYKYGFGFATEYVNEEIRLGRMTRQTGIQYIEEYDGTCSDEYINSFCDYIQISVKDFWEHVHKSLNPLLFELDSAGSIQKRFKVGSGLL